MEVGATGTPQCIATDESGGLHTWTFFVASSNVNVAKHVFVYGAWSQLPVDSNNRPEDPPRIIKTETVLPYFDDIVVRETAKKAVKVEPKPKRKVKGTKNFSLMSFGDEVRGHNPSALLSVPSCHGCPRRR